MLLLLTGALPTSVPLLFMLPSLLSIVELLLFVEMPKKVASFCAHFSGSVTISSKTLQCTCFKSHVFNV